MKFASTAELISYLHHTTLPTLVVEGRDDMSFLRPLEREIDGLDIVVADGKKAALAIAEVIPSFPTPVAVLVDADFWSVLGTPGNIIANKSIIVTDGYSIENDLLRDANAELLLTPQELKRFISVRPILALWFAACVESSKSAKITVWREKLSKILDLNIGCLSPSHQGLTWIFPPPSHLTNEIYSNFERMFRGKTLKSLYNVFLSASGRLPTIDLNSVMAAAWVGQGALKERIKSDIRKALNE